MSAIVSYSETTWAVGIAQLIHHEVQGGAIAPIADRVVSWLRNTDRPCRVAFIPHFIWATICIFVSLTVLENSKRIH